MKNVQQQNNKIEEKKKWQRTTKPKRTNEFEEKITKNRGYYFSVITCVLSYFFIII
jgi:hypothetical protein